MRQETKGKTILRSVLTVLLLILFSVSVTLSTTSLVLGKLVSQKHVMELVERIGYEEMVRNNIRTSFESLCQTSGVPQTLTDDFLEEEVTEDMILLPIRQMFCAETLTLDTDALKNAFAARVQAYALELRQSGDLDVSDEDWESMKAGFPEMANYFVKEIVASIRLSGLFSPLGSAFSVIARIWPYSTWFGLGILFLCGCLLVLLWKGRVWYVAYVAFATSGILHLLPACLYRAENYVMRLGICPNYLKRFLAGLTDDLACSLLQIGAFLVALGALFAVIGFLLCRKRKKIQKTEEEKEVTL